MKDLGPLLLHSVSYAGFWGQACLPLDRFIDKAADLGYDGVMLMAKRPHLSVLDYSTTERRRLRDQLDARGLRRVCIAGYTNFTGDLEHGDIPHLEIQTQHVVQLARMAQELGGDLVRVFTGYESSAASYGAQWKLVVQSLRECARRAAEFGVTIGVQNHHDIAAGFEALYDLIREVNEPNCRAMFDAWAPYLHGADLQAAAQKLGPVTVHTTIADYQQRPRYRYHPGVVNYTAETPLVHRQCRWVRGQSTILDSSVRFRKPALAPAWLMKCALRCRLEAPWSRWTSAPGDSLSICERSNSGRTRESRSPLCTGQRERGGLLLNIAAKTVRPENVRSPTLPGVV